MISLSDSGLAHLAIAACAVPREQRRQWLERLAERLDPAPVSPAAERMRRHRQRARAGRVALTIEASEVDLSETLIDAGILKPGAADDRRAIAAAVERLLDLLITENAARGDA